MQDQRVCPGHTGKKCSVFMSPLIRDPHIHCPRCRGNKCTIDNTCIICKSWPPEQWDLFSKKKSYAFSKARRGRSVSLSASPAPSVVGTSVGRPSVPPASPPPSRDQVVMGGQPSVGVSVGCLGSAPSGSVTMATGYVSDDVAASPVPPPASGGEGGQERLPPACSPIPGLSSTRLPSPSKRVKRVDTSGSAHSGLSRSPSTERERGGKRRGKRSRSPSRYRSRSTSGERRGRGSRYRQQSRERRDRYSDMERSRRSRDFYRERSRDRRDSREYRTRDSRKRSLYRSLSRERAYRSRTPSERGGLAGRCDKSGTSLPKEKKLSEVGAVGHMIQNVMSSFQKSLEAFGENTSNSSSAGASSRGTPSPRGERPAKSVSSARQGGASSSRARASSCHEEREERARRFMRRPDRSTGDRGQSPTRKRRRSRSPSVISLSGSDNVSLHPSDSLSNEADGGSEMRATDPPASVTPGADASRSGSRTSRDRSPQPGPSSQPQADAAPREQRDGERHDARAFPAAPGEGEDERAGSTEPPVLEKDAPFRQVLKSIRDFHGFPTPPETTPHPDRSAMARHLGLPLDHAPALHLPASQLTKDLVDNTNAHMHKFDEDQTQGAFLPIPGLRSRRFYRTSEPLFPAPYQIPPGVAPLVQESSTDVKRRSTTFSPSLSSSQEVLLSSACETASWIDLALPACSNFGSHLPADAKPEFERMMLSVGRAVEFLASQVMTALGNHVLAKRDSLLRDPQSMVPVEALSRLRHAPLPSSSAAIFPTPLLNEALSKSRASANDALVKKSLHPLRIPKKVSSGQGRSRPHASSVDRGGESPVTPRSQGNSQHQRSSNSGHRGKKSRRGGQAKGNRSNNNRGSGRKGGGKRHS